jgi:hypothetical protein
MVHRLIGASSLEVIREEDLGGSDLSVVVS